MAKKDTWLNVPFSPQSPYSKEVYPKMIRVKGQIFTPLEIKVNKSTKLAQYSDPRQNSVFRGVGIGRGNIAYSDDNITTLTSLVSECVNISTILWIKTKEYQLRSKFKI